MIVGVHFKLLDELGPANLAILVRVQLGHHLVDLVLCETNVSSDGISEFLCGDEAILILVKLLESLLKSARRRMHNAAQLLNDIRVKLHLRRRSCLDSRATIIARGSFGTSHTLYGGEARVVQCFKVCSEQVSVDDALVTLTGDHAPQAVDLLGFELIIGQ